MHICMYVIVFKDNCEQNEKYNKDKLWYTESLFTKRNNPTLPDLQ